MRIQRLALAVLLVLAAPGAAESPLSADGTPGTFSGQLAMGEGMTLLQLDAPATIVAHVANVIEPVSSVESTLQVRAVSEDIARAMAEALRASARVTISGRLWWSGATPSYVIEAVSITSR